MAQVDHSLARTANKGTKKIGNRTIEVSVRFWTDGITTQDAIIQKHAWDSGTVSVKKNKLHCITPRRTRPFNSLLELQSAIADILEEHKITLHPSPKLSKVIKP